MFGWRRSSGNTCWPLVSSQNVVFVHPLVNRGARSAWPAKKQKQSSPNSCQRRIPGSNQGLFTPLLFILWSIIIKIIIRASNHYATNGAKCGALNKKIYICTIQYKNVLQILFNERMKGFLAMLRHKLCFVCLLWLSQRQYCFFIFIFLIVMPPIFFYSTVSLPVCLVTFRKLKIQKKKKKRQEENHLLKGCDSKSLL